MSDETTDPAFEPWTCPECGHENEAETVLCHGCGWDSSHPSDDEDPEAA